MTERSDIQEVEQDVANREVREQLDIVRLAEDRQGEWRVMFANGIEVLLGGEQFTERMHRLLIAYRQVLADDPRGVEYVDARYFSGIAVKFTDRDDATMTASVIPAPTRSTENAL